MVDSNLLRFLQSKTLQSKGQSHAYLDVEDGDDEQHNSTWLYQMLSTAPFVSPPMAILHL
jgi:hypothetical protein